MKICGECGNQIQGSIWLHIREVHGFQYYVMGPDFVHYFGSNTWPPTSEFGDKIVDPNIDFRKGYRLKQGYGREK